MSHSLLLALSLRGSDRGPPREREYDNKYQPEGYRREHEAIRHRERDRDYPRPERGHGGYDDRRPDVATGRYERGGRNPDVYRPHGLPGKLPYINLQSLYIEYEDLKS